MLAVLLRCRPLLLAALLLACTAPAVRADDLRTRGTLQRLATPIKFNGFQPDPKMTLEEVLDFLAERYDVTFTVNEAAFRAEEVKDVLSEAIAHRGVPKMFNVRLSTVLHKILDRVPATSGATYVVRRDGIEITTVAALRAEVWGKDHPGPFFPLVHDCFVLRPLNEAVQDLAADSGVNIMIDNHAAAKAQTPVSADLTNTPVDTAVRLLADSAGLKAVLVENVLYVTTRENAAELEAKEKQKRQPPPGAGASGETKPAADPSKK